VTALSPTQLAFLGDNPFVGVVTDLRTDGSPHSTVVWVDVDDDGVSFNTAHGRCKPRNLALDGRLSLTVVDPGNAFRWISISGRATLADDGADAQIDRLAKKYIGEDVYPWRSPGERRVSVRISPELIDGQGLED
jgi:PPOX class probable F420-dependent enzyme